MHDIDYIKKNPDVFDVQMNNRNAPRIAREIIELDEGKRKYIKSIQDYQQNRNRLSKIIGQEKKLKKIN